MAEVVGLSPRVAPCYFFAVMPQLSQIAFLAGHGQKIAPGKSLLRTLSRGPVYKSLSKGTLYKELSKSPNPKAPI